MMLRIMLCALIAFMPITSSAEDEIKCNLEGSQAELNVCANDDFAKADKELNQTYQALIKKAAKDPLFINKLRLAQKAWLAFRDADLEATFACSEKDITICWGSMYPMLFLGRKTELTRERTRHFQQMLAEDRWQ